jgi:hypothetical protein
MNIFFCLYAGWILLICFYWIAISTFVFLYTSNLLVFWPHSVFGQNHLYVRLLQTGIPLFRVKSEEFQSSLSAVRTMCHPVWTPILVLIPSGYFTVSRSFCASLLRPDAYQFSNGSLILSKFQEREDQSTVRMMWYTVRTRISVRQESQFKMNRPDI